MAVAVIVTMIVVLGGAMLVGALGGAAEIPGIDADVCVETSPTGDPGFRRGEGESTGPVGLDEGIVWHAQQIQLCDPDADVATRALGGVGLLVWVLAPLLFFGLLWRMLRQARREGVFADRVPGALRRLGGFLLVWAALDFVVTGAVNGALLSRMTDSLVFFASSDFPWLQVLLAIALLALAQVMAEAVTMRHDVESTI
jgi:hypothetical protein